MELAKWKTIELRFCVFYVNYDVAPLCGFYVGRNWLLRQDFRNGESPLNQTLDENRIAAKVCSAVQNSLMRIWVDAWPTGLHSSSKIVRVTIGKSVHWNGITTSLQFVRKVSNNRVFQNKQIHFKYLCRTYSLLCLELFRCRHVPHDWNTIGY